MALTRSALIVMAIAIVPTCIAVFWFNIRNLRIKTSLTKTLTTNVLAFGVVLSLVPYSIVFGFAHHQGWLDAFTPAMLLLGQESSALEIRSPKLLRWFSVLIAYYVVSLAWFCAVTKWVEWNLRLPFYEKAERVSLTAIGVRQIAHACAMWLVRKWPFQTLNRIAFNSFKALDVADPLREYSWSVGAGYRVEVDLQLAGIDFIFSGTLDEIGPSVNADTDGLFVSDVLKIPSHLASAPAKNLLASLEGDASAVWDSRKVLKSMFFPWSAISNVNIRKVRLRKYRVRTPG